MEKQNEDVVEIDLMEVLGLFLGRIWLIMSVGVFAALVCFLISRFVLTPVYESTTRIYILNKNESTAVTYSDVQLGTQLTKDYAELIGSRYVLEEVIRKLSLDMEYGELHDKVKVETPADTRIVSITVEDPDPVLAMEAANCIREVASAHIRNVMDIDAVNVVESANMPTGKSGPNCMLWTLAGALAGMFAVCAVILVRYLTDDTVKSSEDVEKYLGLSTLALIPVSEGEEAESAGKRKRKRA